MADGGAKDGAKASARVRGTAARVLRLAQPEWRTLGLGSVFLLLGSGASLVYPQAIKALIDGALSSGRSADVDRAAILMAVVFALQGVAMALRYVLFNIAGERIVARLRERLYAAVLGQEIAFFDQRKTGELTSRLAADATVLQSTVSANVSMVLRNLVTVIGGVALLIWTSPTLAALMLTVVPPVALGAVTVGRRIRALSKEVQDALARASELAEESLSGIRTVRIFAAEGMEAKRYGGAVEHSFQLARKRSIFGGVFMGVAATLAYGAAALVLWYGGRLVVAGEMSVGQLTSFLLYSLLVAFSLGALGDLWADFMKASGAAERVFELIDRRPLIPLHGGERPAKAEGRVELDRVTFAYPTRPEVRVLDEIAFVIEPGEIVAMVGHSGAGKSTIAGLLTRLYDPGDGRVRFDGHDLRALDPDWLRRQIGVVSQEPILFSSSIADNIRYGRPDASDAEVEAAALAANAHDFVQKFPDGYRTLVGERGVQLSGGQKQRVAIARAVLKDPRLLVLDEATSALDAESEFLVKEALDRLMEGRTTLIIAHRLSTVIDADRVLVLDGGRVVQSGDHHALMLQGGLYRRLVEKQFVAA
jgi:ATP-binding cassette subfamily B protein